MNPDEFAEAMKQIWETEDTERAHASADALMCNVLMFIGYGKGIEIFQSKGKWYT